MANWKLKTKLVVAMMGTNAIGMLVVAAAFISNNLALLDSRLDSRISTELDLMSKNIGPALLFKDRDSATDMLDTLAVDNAILSAELFHNEHKDSLASYRKDLNEDDTFLASEYLVRHSRPVIVDGETQGRLDFIATTREVELQVRQLIIYSITVLVVATLLVFLCAMKIQGLITAPVIALNSLAKNVARSRNYKLRSTIKKRDEIGELAHEFNRMLAQIENRDTMLERQVQQRTAELEKLAEEFRHRAFHDSLTELPNRALLSEYFESAVAHAERNKTRILLMLLDLDDFKTINDSLGHDYGDELLKVVARRLKSALRNDDVIVRLGGDEFVILVEQISMQADASEVAIHVADQVLQHVQGDALVGDRHIGITASIGGSYYPDDGKDLVSLKRSADVAMYHSKDQGRNRFSLFTPEMQRSIK